MHDVVLAVHVAAGATGLLLGPVWLWARRSGMRARPGAWGYQAAVAVVSASGAVLAVTTTGLGWLLPLAVLTESLAITGALARRRSWRRWPTVQPHLLGGSYIALVTGALVAQTGNPLFWVLPAVVGQLPIALAERRLHAVARIPVPT